MADPRRGPPVYFLDEADYVGGRLVDWSNSISATKPMTAKEIISTGWAAMLGCIYPAHVAMLGKQYGFRRAHAWETPNAYRQSLVAFLTIRTMR